MNPSQLTAIYYSAHEDPEWSEQRVRQTHLNMMGDIPLISVTQKSIDYGENICVGEVGISSQNAYRQFLIGAEAAETEYICPIEADFLYPPEYFRFQPKQADVIYVMVPVWVMFAMKGKVRIFAQKPHGSEAAIVVNRQFFIDVMSNSLKELGKWRAKNDEVVIPHLFRTGVKIEEVILPNPIITIKTDNQMGRKVPHMKSSRRRNIPFWGSWSKMYTTYLQQ